MAEEARPQDSSEERPFEVVLAELEQTVERLERGNLPLADCLAAFERGMKLVASADERLSSAEARVEVLLRGADGMDSTVPFAEQSPDLDVPSSGE